MLQNHPLISVIVPIYNVGSYLKTCVDSILTQTYTDLEIILVDDGSTDDCRDMCDAYAKKDSRITVLHQEHGGASAARNAGLDICKGDYISFIDSDDFVSPCFIELLYRALQETESEIASVMFHRGFTDQQEENVRLEQNANAHSVSVLEPREAIRRMLYIKASAGVPYYLFGRSIFQDLRFPVGYLYEDMITTPKALMRAGRVSFVDAQIYAYRIRPGSTMHSGFSPAKLDAIRICREFADIIHAYDPTLDKAAAVRVLSLISHVFFQIPWEDRSYREKLWTEILRCRALIVRDRSRDVPLKKRLVAWCTYLGMDATYVIGKLYKRFIKRPLGQGQRPHRR